MSEPKKQVILAATDGSEGSTVALKKAAVAASTNRAELLVLTVAPRGLQPTAITNQLREYAQAEHLGRGESEAVSLIAEGILADARQIIGPSKKDGKALYLSRAGDPAEEILACAKEHAADVIYLGSRGRGSLGALLLGSVSQQVSDSADCQVIIVPTPPINVDLH
jgi:nucleotide-binding universal stress UspA family protein